MKAHLNDIKRCLRKSWFSLSLLCFTIINLTLRTFFIFYGYISTDEGIALYNTKLAYSGYLPFVDYNGWNSLLNDFIFGFTNLFMHPTIMSQRIVAASISLTIFFCCSYISYLLMGKKSALLTAFLLTLGSSLYLYYSTTPTSIQPMTLILLLSLFCLVWLFKKRPENSFLFETAALTLSSINILIRSQTIPFFILILIYLCFRANRTKYLLKALALSLLTSSLLILPFLTRSPLHTAYAFFWPFFAPKILLYVSDLPLSMVSQLLNYLILVMRDYGIFVITITAGLLIFKPTFKSEMGKFLLLSLGIIGIFFMTSLIHHPIEPAYIYPAVPLLSLVASIFIAKILNRLPPKTALFFYIFVFGYVGQSFLTFPHFKFMKTSLATIQNTPHQYLAHINDFIEKETNQNDQIITFYLPAVAQTNRGIPIVMNEGAGSISILNSAEAEKYHLTSLETLRSIIKERKIALFIFADSFRYYFGRTDVEREQTFALLQSNYALTKTFTNFNQIDGSNSKNLYIYSPKPY